MTETGWLAERFEAHRAHLRAVAYRMLGSPSEADDAVQEAWLRVSRADTGQVENLGGWLTTVVARVSLDMLRARGVRREEPLDGHLPDPAALLAESTDPEQEALLADAVGPALLVVLDTLTPAERLAFVLHDLFGVPFDEIAAILGRSPAAARQLASRARRRVQGADPDPGADRTRQRRVVDAFLAAARDGDLARLTDLVAADATAWTDGGGRVRAARNPVHGPDRVARFFTGVYGRRRPTIEAASAELNGAPALVLHWPDGTRYALTLAAADGRITDLYLVGNPEKLTGLTG
jgi:RNA polymerase sigma-70 factor (ECF subfamily)